MSDQILNEETIALKFQELYDLGFKNMQDMIDGKISIKEAKEKNRYINALFSQLQREIKNSDMLKNKTITNSRSTNPNLKIMENTPPVDEDPPKPKDVNDSPEEITIPSSS